jgi:hypothetical protein
LRYNLKLTDGQFESLKFKAKSAKLLRPTHQKGTRWSADRKGKACLLVRGGNYKKEYGKQETGEKLNTEYRRQKENEHRIRLRRKWDKS